MQCLSGRNSPKLQNISDSTTMDKQIHKTKVEATLRNQSNHERKANLLDDGNAPNPH